VFAPGTPGLPFWRAPERFCGYLGDAFGALFDALSRGAGIAGIAREHVPNNTRPEHDEEAKHNALHFNPFQALFGLQPVDSLAGEDRAREGVAISAVRPYLLYSSCKSSGKSLIPCHFQNYLVPSLYPLRDF
jgi:hypothetical protein